MGKRDKAATEDAGSSAPYSRGVGSSRGGDTPVADMAGDLSFPRWLPAVLYGAVTLLLFRKFVFSGVMLWGQDTLFLGFMVTGVVLNRPAGGIPDEHIFR